MAFERLLHQPATEPELFERLTAFVCDEYHGLRQKSAYFIKFERVNEELSQFSYTREFNNRGECRGFKWSSEYNRCGVTIYRDDEHFYLIAFGYFYSFTANVFADRIEIEKVDRNDPGYEHEKIKQPPRELVEAAMREFTILANIAKSQRGSA